MGVYGFIEHRRIAADARQNAFRGLEEMVAGWRAERPAQDRQDAPASAAVKKTSSKRPSWAAVQPGLRGAAVFGSRDAAIAAARSSVSAIEGAVRDASGLHRKVHDFFIGGFEEVGPRPQIMDLRADLDLHDEGDAYEIETLLPDVTRESLELVLSSGLLTIKSKPLPTGSPFHRSVFVPSGVDADKVRATISKGLLHVVLPKTEETKHSEKRIDIIEDDASSALS
ncbi:Hsp20/alpha crystallin family protein [Tranquillimonas alkanivorans]|nr:Hsp20/alpha crystallin family protein [Tranquillimonas alkanivorans]